MDKTNCESKQIDIYKTIEGPIEYTYFSSSLKCSLR